MKLIIFCTLLVFVCFNNIFAQPYKHKTYTGEILTPSEVKFHIGDSVTVIGKIVEIYRDDFNDNLPFYLNFEIKYPHNPLAAVVYWHDLNFILNKNPFLYINKVVKITGTLNAIKSNETIVSCITINRTNQIIINNK